MAKTHGKPGPKAKGKRRDYHIQLLEASGLADEFERIAKMNGGVVAFVEKTIQQLPEIRFARAHNAEYLAQIKQLIQQHLGCKFTYTYESGVRVSLWADNLWHGEVSSFDGCHANTFEEVVACLRLDSWMDQTMIELVEAFEEQSQREQGE